MVMSRLEKDSARIIKCIRIPRKSLSNIDKKIPMMDELNKYFFLLITAFATEFVLKLFKKLLSLIVFVIIAIHYFNQFI